MTMSAPRGYYANYERSLSVKRQQICQPSLVASDLRHTTDNAAWASHFPGRIAWARKCASDCAIGPIGDAIQCQFAPTQVPEKTACATQPWWLTSACLGDCVCTI